MWYQQIEHDGKVLVKGHDRMPEYRGIFPEPPAGISVLDVGSCIGFYVFQAVKEGATLGHGVEPNEKSRNLANELRDKMGFPLDNVVFTDGRIETLDTGIRYNTVLCLNVLHHLPDIETVERGLINLDRHASQRIVLMTLKPKDGKPWSRRRQLKRRIALAPEYFMALFPDYEIGVRDSALTKKRYIIDIRKGGQCSSS